MLYPEEKRQLEHVVKKMSTTAMLFQWITIPHLMIEQSAEPIKKNLRKYIPVMEHLFKEYKYLRAKQLEQEVI